LTCDELQGVYFDLPLEYKEVLNATSVHGDFYARKISPTHFESYDGLISISFSMSVHSRMRNLLDEHPNIQWPKLWHVSFRGVVTLVSRVSSPCLTRVTQWDGKLKTGDYSTASVRFTDAAQEFIPSTPSPSYNTRFLPPKLASAPNGPTQSFDSYEPKLASAPNGPTQSFDSYDLTYILHGFLFCVLVLGAFTLSYLIYYCSCTVEGVEVGV